MPKLSIVKVKLDREVNCYVVSCATTKEAVVIDPGQPVDLIVEQTGNVTVKHILATHGPPGHTPGSVCFVVANHAFVGDTILAGGIGRQMPETDLRRQMMSIGTKLLRLPVSTALYPGHGPATSLERELAQNPIFRGAGARA